MALAIILIAMFVFSIVMFAIANQQQHETRFTAISLEQEKAFVLADAGLARAMARCVSRDYAHRWYGQPSVDDQLPALEHAGLLDESSQSHDEGTGGGPPAPGRKLDPRGTYTVLVEDRHDGQTAGDDPTASSRLAYTDVFSRGTIAGPHGDVAALLFARIAIAPEVSFFPPAGSVSSTAASTAVTDFSTPELIKRVIRYQVYFDPETADHPYANSSADTSVLQAKVHNEVAQFHQNFLKNRNTFKDLRDPSKVNASWHADTATRAQWTKADIIGLFAGIAPLADVPPGSNAPPANPPPDNSPGTFFNMWIDYMLRSYRVSDAVPANTGVHYAIGANPTAQEDRVANNILSAFYNQHLTPVPPPLKPPGVATADEMLTLLAPNVNVNDPRRSYDTSVSSFHREEASAVILRGIWNPAPGTFPTSSPPPPEAIAQSYHDHNFEQLFLNTDNLTSHVLDDMRAEIKRVNDLHASPQLSESTYIVKGPIAQQPYPIYLRYDTPPVAQSAPTTTPVQISVPQLVRLYDKYVETQALFTDGNPANIVPVPPVPTTPPPNRPPNNGNGNGGGGNNGGGGQRPGGFSISGQTTGL